MTRYIGSDIYFSLDSQELTGITAVNGLPGPQEHHDSTAIGDAGRVDTAGLEAVTFTIEGWYDDTATTGTSIVLEDIRSDGTDTAYAFEYGPAGDASGKEKWSGNAKLLDYEIVGRVGEVVSIRAELKVQGAVTAGTFSA